MWALGRRPEQICHGRPRSARIIRAKKDRGGDESNAEGRDAGIRRGLNELPSLWRRVVAGDVFALDSERRNGPTILHIKVNKLVQFAITRGQRPAIFPHIGDTPENHAMVNAPNLVIDSHHDDDAAAWLH
jgi:hypothetical protein